MTIRYTYWQENDAYIGYLEDYPDYRTQGTSLEDLQAHLSDLYADITAGHIPSIRTTAEMELV